MIYSIIYLILDVIGIGILFAAADRNYTVRVDGVVMSTSDLNAYSTATFAIVGVVIAVRILTILGAGLYNKWVVGFGALWEIVTVILSFVALAAKPATTVSWSDGSVRYTYTTNPVAVVILTLIFSGLIFYVSCCIVWV